MIELKRNLLAVLAPLMILSLAPAVYAGNEPVQTAPSTLPKKHVRAMDRPEMAGFKRITMFAFKYRQKLSNMAAVLSQAKRTSAISDENHKKLQAELDRLNEIEPSLARGDWKQADIEAFDKQIANYEHEYDKANKKETVKFASPAATTSTVTTTTTKSKETKTLKNSKDAKDAKESKNSKDSKESKVSSTAPAKK